MGAHSNMPQDALDDFHYYSLIISPTFKIPELTKPVIELTLPSGSGGENSSFDPAANTLIIQYQTPTTTLNGWLRIHAPDVGGSAALIFALLIIFSLRHILRRPQSHGHLYCRNCNYDLTQWQQPTPAQPAGICLECGVSTLAKPPIRGRFMTRRILPIWSIFLPLFLLSSIVWYSSIELIGPVGPGRTAWPFEALSRLSWWTMARPKIPQHYSRVFETYSLPTGQKVSTFVLDSNRGDVGRPTSDLRYYAFAEKSEESNWDNLAVVCEPATGHTRSYNMGNNSTGWLRFHGYTSDEKEAIYTLASHTNQDGKSAAKIFCVSLDTLAVREIATVNFSLNLIAPSTWQAPNIAAAVNNEPQQWAFLITDGIDAGLLQYSPAPSGELGESKLAVTLPINGYSSNTLSYSADDKLMLNDGTLEIIPETGAVSPLAVVTHSARMAEVGTLEIYSGANLSQIIQVDPNISFLATNRTFSSDGRWVLVEGYLNNNPTLLGPLTAKFLLFDLSKVQPVDPSSTR